MKRMVTLVAVILVMLGFMSLPAGASTQDFTIQSFEADYYLGREPDGTSTLKVAETIVAVFPSFDQNHGLLRAIPESYQNHSLSLKIESVSDEAGNPLDYETQSVNGNKVLKIGNADVFVHGVKTYKISYTMRGVTSKPSDAGQAEFYWDTNGTDWQQAVNRVVARVHMPTGLASALQPQRSCYTGVAGSTETNCQLSVVPGQDETIIMARTTGSLKAGENLTVALAFAKDTFAVYKPTFLELFWLIALPVLTVLPPLVALFVVLRNWFKRGRDPRGKGVIVPQYLPPDNVSVMGSSAILKEGFSPRAISAQIIDLAVRHYLKVYEIPKKNLFGKPSYELELVKAANGARPEEQTVLNMLFGKAAGPGQRVQLESLSKKLYTEAAKLGKSVNQTMTTAGYFAANPDKARLPYVAAGVTLLIIGFFSLIFVVGIGFIIAGTITLIGAAIIPARSSRGVALREYLFGLRDYMKLAEADRLKVLQSPHGELTEKIDTGDRGQLVKLYEKLLPYAMLFGIEKEWVKELAPLYEQPPEWYSNSAGFQPTLFMASMSSFSAATTQSFSLPSSSGTSGAGGGGSSGGGGGGGGGGGW